jgi:hypothetical protein
MSRGRKLDLADAPMKRLVSLAATAQAKRAEILELAGMACAEMYRRGLKWPEIEKLTGVPLQTAHRWAKPYMADESAEDTSG